MAASGSAAPTDRASRRPDVALGVVILLVALAARIGTVYANGSLGDGTGYDPAVYYASADALVHGLVPYRDYTLLHPPGLSLLLAPVALIGRATSDHTGFVLASVLSSLIGSVNALLVARIARRLRFSRTAATAAGLFYAVTQLSVRAETDAHLEGWGNLFVLLGIYFAVGAARSGSRRACVVAGAALAAAASVKIWYAVVLLIVIAWLSVGVRGRRAWLLAVGGALLAAVCIDGPFLVLAGRRMLSMVVGDQVGRPSETALGHLARASDLDLSTVLLPHASHRTWIAVAAVAGVALAVVLALALSVPAGRLPAVLALAQLAVLFLAPVYFYFYSDYVMPALSISLAAAISAIERRSPSARRAGAIAGAALIGLSTAAFIRIDLVDPPNTVVAAPGPAMQRAAASVRCVQSTSPMPLILLNVLSRDFQDGCRQWVDVSGRTYGVDRSARNLPRSQNQRWQKDVLRYLLSGEQYVVVDSVREGLTRRTLSVLGRGPVIAGDPSFLLRRTLPSQAAAVGPQRRT